MLMKALVKKQPGEGIWLEQVPVPAYGNNDLLVKVTHTAICGTDLHIYKWDEWSQRTIRTPMTNGSPPSSNIPPNCDIFRPFP